MYNVYCISALSYTKSLVEPRPNTYSSICGRYCIGFYIHSASHTGSCPWRGGAYLAGHPPTCVSFAPSFFSCWPPPCAAILYPTVTPIRPHCDNVEPFLFWGRSSNLIGLSSALRHLPKRCLFSFSSATFSYWLGSGEFWGHEWCGGALVNQASTLTIGFLLTN